MPRFILPSKTHSPQHEKFVKKLVQEFSATSANLQPLILEERVPATRSRHVRVIWDAWKSLDDEQRSAIIVDAYLAAEGAEAASEITIAEGFTPQEALALGLLPYQIAPARKKADPIAEKAYRAALASEARHTILGPKAKELRFARMEDATQTITRLRQVLPGSAWILVQETDLES